MVDVAGARVLAILTRAPSAGGKSRLFAALGRPPDPALIARVIAVAPRDGCGEIAALVPSDVIVIPQSDGDLGARMQAVFASLLGAGAAAVVLIGSDLPTIDRASVSAAFETLAGDSGALVLGPAADGGYYLIGAARVPPVFDAIEWGSDGVLERTRTLAENAGLRVSVVDVIEDVDTADALFRVADSGRAQRTSAWIEDTPGIKDVK
jgi:glycosyltransferase A (GT-A) superfamily protein (DUF2064 family)